jgi:hypothetical protein
MLADNAVGTTCGALNGTVHKPATFLKELLQFIGDELPRWRDRPDRRVDRAETVLTSQLCAHLNSAARRSDGWDILQFRVEEPDAAKRNRKIDLVPAPAGTTVCIEGRRHTDFDALLPIECKRLPTPRESDREEREYVFTENSTSGGIQRFKEGAHGAGHSRGAMIGYIQDGSVSSWADTVSAWVSGLVGVKRGWTGDDVPVLEADDATSGTGRLRSLHGRQGLENIELCHLWIRMN